MSNFIPLNSEKEETLSELLEQHPLIPDADSFIQAYNDGLVNKSNDVIVSIAEQIAQTYKNVELKRNVLAFVSEEEMSLNDLTKIVQAWRFGLTLKHELKALESEDMQINTVLIGNNDALASALYENDSNANHFSEYEDEEGTITPLTSKLVNTRDNPQSLIDVLGLSYTEQDNGFVLDVNEAINLDGSILSNAVSAIENDPKESSSWRA